MLLNNGFLNLLLLQNRDEKKHFHRNQASGNMLKELWEAYSLT